ncbi:uncharacterized protein LOC126892239 [Diabrotica virgifera virgifera]|uniref:DDE Tnp4 domain-containing protein n=1 Tax=Diabrotica virgifera virgifera TaxID=50390 RepID=A0ABM5L5H5_DIAVI|nr:uncharacterized protein LOC126892239 [Diabrotica virgifera virgifera]
MHDARVFRMSEIYDCLTRADPILPPNMHLIGDLAYPLLMNLMKPYQNNGHLLPVQVNFNNKLSSIRSVIERAFGLLKCKFRRLKFLDTDTSQMANRIVLAACVLHNFIILEGNVPDEYNVENNIVNNEGDDVEINDVMVGGADQKRRDIAQQCDMENN